MLEYKGRSENLKMKNDESFLFVLINRKNEKKLNSLENQNQIEKTGSDFQVSTVLFDT